MADLQRTAALLRALAEGQVPRRAAETADLDWPQAVAALQDLADRLESKARKATPAEPPAEPHADMQPGEIADPDALVFAFDGGSRGNPGPAAGAGVARDADGTTLAERSRYLEEATNNVAEYHGLLAAIELASELGVRRLRLQGDSELVAKQLSGEYRVKHKNIMPLFVQAIRALRTFDHWEIRYVPREENAAADALVNRLLDAHTGKRKSRRPRK